MKSSLFNGAVLIRVGWYLPRSVVIQAQFFIKVILDGVAKCIICQEDKSETLKSVLKAGNEAFYSSVLTNVKEFCSSY